MQVYTIAAPGPYREATTRGRDAGEGLLNLVICLTPRDQNYGGAMKETIKAASKRIQLFHRKEMVGRRGFGTRPHEKRRGGDRTPRKASNQC